LTELAALLRQRSALVLWDVDDKLESRTVHTDSMVQATRTLLDAARAHGVPRIWGHHQFLPAGFESEAFRDSLERRGVKAPSVGSEAGFRIDLVPRDDELVLHKFRTSFFIGTPLLNVLANIKADVIVLCGASTDTGILGTARDAVPHGVIPVVASDAVTSSSEERHESGLTEIRALGYVSSAAEIAGAWAD
jgi:maleamate amidohydrolase